MCLDMAEGVLKSSDLIIKFLLPIETSCLSKLICLALIIKYFRYEIIGHINHDDFNKMVSNNDFQYESFQEHLQYFQNLNSVKINSIFLSVSIKILN